MTSSMFFVLIAICLVNLPGAIMRPSASAADQGGDVIQQQHIEPKELQQMGPMMDGKFLDHIGTNVGGNGDASAAAGGNNDGGHGRRRRLRRQQADEIDAEDVQEYGRKLVSHYGRLGFLTSSRNGSKEVVFCPAVFAMAKQKLDELRQQILQRKCFAVIEFFVKEMEKMKENGFKKEEMLGHWVLILTALADDQGPCVQAKELMYTVKGMAVATADGVALKQIEELQTANKWAKKGVLERAFKAMDDD